MRDAVNLRQESEFQRAELCSTGEISSFLSTVLTNEAYEAVKDIPVVTGPLIGSGLASGTSATSKIISIFMFGDWERRVVMSNVGIQEFGVEGILHEVIHHLDDLTRDGEAEFIDIDEFLYGYEVCASDTQYHGIYRFVENRNPDSFVSVFGVGDHAERIAFCGQLFWKQGGPPELERAFRRIFRKFQEKYPN